MNRFQFLVGLMGLSLVGLSSEKLTPVSIGSCRYYPLDRIAKSLGCTFLQNGKSLILKKKGLLFRMTLERREAVFNQVSVSLSFAPIKESSRYYLSVIDYDNLLYLLAINSQRVTKPVRIMLDPGHGGKDPGCLSANKKIKEASIVLDVAKRLAENLRIWGFTVILTRTKDIFLTLEKRTELAKRWKADLFLSIHVNTVGGVNNNVSGVETHILPPEKAPATNSNKPLKNKAKGHEYSKLNLLLGYDIQQSLLRASRANDRSVRYSTFSVLRSAPCPAALIELGFLSHSAEQQKLISDSYQQLLVAGIVGGIRSYKKRST